MGHESKKDILCVDDCQSTRELLRITLSSQRFSYNIHEAITGGEGWERAIDHCYDLFILDYHIPLIDGITLATKLRSHQWYWDTPIFIMTADLSKEARDHARSVGVTGWIVKPFPPLKLQKAIEYAFAM